MGIRRPAARRAARLHSRETRAINQEATLFRTGAAMRGADVYYPGWQERRSGWGASYGRACRYSAARQDFGPSARCTRDAADTRAGGTLGRARPIAKPRARAYRAR